jgi:hypothetical protein
MHWVPKLLISMFWLHSTLVLTDTAGVKHQPLQLRDQKAAVFIFVAVDCPISNSYAPEINRIMKASKDKKLDFYIVYSDANLSPADAKKHMKQYGYACPGLMDTGQALAKKLKAGVTPEAVVVDPHGKVLYQGRIDNWYEDFGKQRYNATKHDLQDALDEILAGKKVTTPVTKAVGCPI